MPQTALEVSVKDQDGKLVFSKNKIYEVYDFHFNHNKQGYLGLNDWDITAMDHVNLGLEPHETDSLTFVVPLEEGTKSVEVEAVFKYIYEKDKSAVINKTTKKVEF
jgi:hypothetical protein